MNEFYASGYLAITVSMAYLLFGFIKRSEFGIVVAYTEMFIFFGAFLYPVLFYSNIVQPAEEGSRFLATTGEPGAATFLHMICYLVGALIGTIVAGKYAQHDSIPSALARARKLVKNEKIFFKGTLLIGIGFLSLYLGLLGWDNAIANAILMRGGDFENIQSGDRQYLFLKSLAFTFTFVVCFMPAILRSDLSKSYVLLYVVFVTMLYVVSVSRMVVLLNLIVPVFFYLRFKCRSTSIFIVTMIFITPVVGLFLFYGKPLGFMLFKLINDGELISIEPYLSEYGLVSAFFGNFEFVWYSIEAGMRNFFETGAPFVPYDLILSSLGFVPSRVLEYWGLSFLDYRFSQPLMACVNTSYFGLDCTVPPRELGLAAYLWPFSGAFIFGLVKFYVFRTQERSFIYIASFDYSKTWYPILVVVLLGMFFTFIPVVTSQFSFFVLLLFMYVSILKLKGAVRGLVRVRTEKEGPLEERGIG